MFEDATTGSWWRQANGEAVAGPLEGMTLPEVLRAVAGIAGLPGWLAQFLRDGRLIIFGLLIAIGAVFFPQGLITPELFRGRGAAASEQAP